MGFLLKYFNHYFLSFVTGLFIFTTLYLLMFNKELNPVKILKKVDRQFISKTTNFKISWLKPILLGTVWASTTIVLPFFQSGDKLSSEIVLLFLIRFLEYSVNGVLFDYQDLNGDVKNNKSNLFRIQKTETIFKFTVIALMLEAGLILFSIYYKILPLVIFSDMIIVAFYIFLIYHIVQNEKYPNPRKFMSTSKFSHPFLVDGILFLPALITFIFY